MKQYVIIGNSAAGIAAVEVIRRADKESKITVVSDEEYSSYCRCLISYYLAGDIKEEKLFYRPENFYKENNIELLLGREVTRVTPKKNHIILGDKEQIGYDYLLVATGASAKFPELKGIKKEGVFGFRTLKDAKDIAGLLPVVKSVCVLGGGLIGLKAAYALKKRNIDVKVIIKSKQVLSQVLDFPAAQLVQKKLEENGIEVILGQDASEIISDEGEIKAVKLDSGKVLAASLVIVGKGVSPNIDPVKDTEIKINEGIISNNNLQTNIPNIYAAGDVAETFDMTLGGFCVNALWPLAVEQGRIAGTNMAGGKINYAGSLGMNSLEFFGLPTVSLGLFRPKDPKEYEEIKMMEEKQQIYKKLVLKNNVLVGAVLVGDINKSGLFLRLINERIDVSSFKDKLLQENFGYPDIMDFTKDKEQVYV
jgi:NAD(P)H-nitrite reductase large subunit